MHPIDHGYAWVVLASCFTISLLIEGFWASAGILLLQWSWYFNVSAAKTAWLGSMLVMLVFSCTKVASALASRFTYRVVATCGGIVISTCLFSMSLTTKLWHIYLLIPTLGIGMGMAYQAAHVAYIPFFDAHFAFATGLVNSACGLGFITISPFMELLVSSYGLNGALKVASATMANICVCGLLLRPFNSHLYHTGSKRIRIPERDSDYSNSDRTIYGYLRAIADDLDLYLLTNVYFIFQTVINGFLYGGLQAFLINIYPFAVSIGVPHLESSLLLSMVGISMLVARLIPLGILVDRKYISAAALAGVAFLIAGLLMILITFMTSFTTLSILVTIYGCSQGVGGPFLMVVVAYSGGSKDKASGAVSWMLFSCGIGTLVLIYSCGYLYDVTGGLQIPIALCGVIVSCIGVNLLVHLCLQHRNSSE